jgi:hypothetical protein
LLSICIFILLLNQEHAALRCVDKPLMTWCSIQKLWILNISHPVPNQVLKWMADPAVIQTHIEELNHGRVVAAVARLAGEDPAAAAHGLLHALQVPTVAHLVPTTTWLGPSPVIMT